MNPLYHTLHDAAIIVATKACDNNPICDQVFSKISMPVREAMNWESEVTITIESIIEIHSINIPSSDNNIIKELIQ